MTVWKIDLAGKKVVAKCEDCGKEWKGFYEDIFGVVENHIRDLPHIVSINEIKD